MTIHFREDSSRWYGTWMMAVGYMDAHGEEAADFVLQANIAPYTGVRGHLLRMINESRYPMPIFA